MTPLRLILAGLAAAALASCGSGACRAAERPGAGLRRRRQRGPAGERLAVPGLSHAHDGRRGGRPVRERRHERPRPPVRPGRKARRPASGSAAAGPESSAPPVATAIVGDSLLVVADWRNRIASAFDRRSGAFVRSARLEGYPMWMQVRRRHGVDVGRELHEEDQPGLLADGRGLGALPGRASRRIRQVLDPPAGTPVRDDAAHGRHHPAGIHGPPRPFPPPPGRDRVRHRGGSRGSPARSSRRTSWSGSRSRSKTTRSPPWDPRWWPCTASPPGEVAAFYLDVTVDGRLITAAGFLSVLSPDLRRACVDIPFEFGRDGRPVVAFRGDTLFTLEQRIVSETRALSASARTTSDTSRCRWLPTEAGSAAPARARWRHRPPAARLTPPLPHARAISHSREGPRLRARLRLRGAGTRPDAPSRELRSPAVRIPFHPRIALSRPTRPSEK